MIDVAILSIIRCWHLRGQIPLRETPSCPGISRGTIRRYLRAEITAPVFPSWLSEIAIKPTVEPLAHAGLMGCNVKLTASPKATALIRLRENPPLRPLPCRSPQIWTK